ncbi:hypothetical protein VTK26DRAFT_184 [Humicola hyalothermophila]
MHYIKLLRPPVLEGGESQASLKLVLTITTDLGDSFLSPAEPIQLLVLGAYTKEIEGPNQLVHVDFAQPLIWRAGMRVLKVDAPVPWQFWRAIKTIQVRPRSPHLTAIRTSDIRAGKQGLIMAAYADISTRGDAAPFAVCFRSLRLPAPNRLLQFEEDIGDSIARHIWDGGVATASLLAELCLESTAEAETLLPSLRSVLQSPGQRPLNILEVGCGIGVLGISIAQILSSMQLPQGATATGATTHILMTDLHEAETRARANMVRQAESIARGSASIQLDFEALDWLDGKEGIFGDKVATRAWDLVVLSDCTYNTDTLSPLVKTLTAIHRHSARRWVEGDEGGPRTTEVFVATKPRHSSERIFFDLMTADGWFIRERAVLPLPVLDGEDQTVEVYLFRMKQE